MFNKQPNPLHLQSSFAPSSLSYTSLLFLSLTSAGQTSCYYTAESTGNPEPSRSSSAHTPPQLARSALRSLSRTRRTAWASPAAPAVRWDTSNTAFSALPPGRPALLKKRSVYCRCREAAAPPRGSSARFDLSDLLRSPHWKTARAIWRSRRRWIRTETTWDDWEALAAWAGRRRESRRDRDFALRRDWEREKGEKGYARG